VASARPFIDRIFADAGYQGRAPRDRCQHWSLTVRDRQEQRTAQIRRVA
jgi:hypothetical protein